MQSAAIADSVIRWQLAHGRSDLPWQASRDPYRVWLSEIMLQQTQVSAVRDYFLRFVERYPDVRSLAAASEDDVFALWSGLGYYSRARNLHRCARQVVELHGGEFPQSAAALEALPGIGRSTAAAIAAFCFGERVAILDGNVKRVLTRVLGFDLDLAKAANERVLWERASELLPQRDLARTMPIYTQGLMDLGATLCHARNPACERCPLGTACIAKRARDPGRYPVRSRKTARLDVDWWMLLARDERDRVWLERRPASGIWSGLFCVPVFDTRDALQLGVTAPCDGIEMRSLPTIEHALTHRNLRLHPVLIDVDSSDWGKPGRVAEPDPAEDSPGRGGHWVAAADRERYGLPAPIRKLLYSLRKT